PFVAVDLNEVVREALEITQARWREEAVSRGVMLEVRNDLAALPQVAAVPVELREALTNLILTAVDAMPGGGVLTLTTAVVDGEVVVTVSDTGVGIPSAIRDRIFDPFFTTKGPQGTGLGLSMTYAILERHGARITVNSEEGRGTTFRLTFVPTWELAEPPRVSGGQVARAIKEMAPAVPVIVVTGFGVELSAEERRAHGVDLVLVKPLKIQEILDVASQLARRRVWRT